MKDSPTQIEYLIDNNILKQPNEVGSDMNPKTEWYDTLSKTEQDIYFLKITEQWWDEYGQHIFNDVYTDVLVGDKVSGNILSEFNQYIKSEMDGFEKYIGLSEYNDNLMRSYLVELGIDVDDADKEDIVQQLQLDNPKIVTTSFDRPNLHIKVARKKNAFEKKWIIP